MRRIFISSSIIQFSKDYNNNLFKSRNSKFDKPINSDGITGKLFDLESYLRKDCILTLYADYVKGIINRYSKINIVQPSDFNYYYNNYFNLDETELAKIVTPPIGTNKFAKQELYKLIVDAMRYDAVRDYEYLPYVKKMGIKSCVYCNAQFSITTERANGRLAGKYELDHFYPQSKYPFLSTSFFNLQPCCSHCNKTKSDRQASFSLFTTVYSEIEPFYFSLDKKSILRYLLNQNEEDLVVIFDSLDTKLKNNHEDIFHITELYNRHKDIVEEIIWKSRIYNKSYKESLSDSFSKYFPNTSNINRFILGNYDSPKDIHKRPMAKLVQDIARQLGII
jgi:hypothetical protein